jgi:hypothetical protein
MRYEKKTITVGKEVRETVVAYFMYSAARARRKRKISQDS